MKGFDDCERCGGRGSYQTLSDHGIGYTRVCDECKRRREDFGRTAPAARINNTPAGEEGSTMGSKNNHETQRVISDAIRRTSLAREAEEFGNLKGAASLLEEADKDIAIARRRIADWMSAMETARKQDQARREAGGEELPGITELSGDETRALADYMESRGHSDFAKMARRAADEKDAIANGSNYIAPDSPRTPHAGEESAAQKAATTLSDKEMVRALEAEMTTAHRRIGDLKDDVDNLRNRVIGHQATAETCEAQIVELRNEVAKLSDAFKAVDDIVSAEVRGSDIVFTKRSGLTAHIPIPQSGGQS